MKENQVIGIARFFGLMFLLVSLFNIFAIFYEVLQPWWKANSEFVTHIFIDVPLSIQLERTGIFLQFLAGLSIIPELIGEEKLRKSELFLKNFHSQIRQTRPLFPISNENDGSGKLERKFILATTVLWMITVMLMWIYPMFSSNPEYANMQKGLFSCFMLMFLAVAVGTGRLMAETLIFLVHGITVWLVKLLPIKRLVSFVSFPLFIIGTLMQLVATFLA